MQQTSANRPSRWFLTDGEAWSPHLYEWWFQRTKTGRLLRSQEHAAVAQNVAAGLRPANTVLEVGSGTGHYTTLLDDLGAHVVARDASEVMVRYLRRRLELEQRQRVPSVEVGRLPDDLRTDGPFDGVLAVGVLNYIDDLTASIDAMSGLLAPGGWLVFTVPPDNRSGRRYRQIERLGRRRVHLRSTDDVVGAVEKAGMVLDGDPDVAGPMAVYRCVSVG